MRYFDRRLLFPVAAATAFAQQQPPEAAAAEAAVRSRAQEFFQMQVDKKYRQAESMVADESKDAYYDGRKFNIKSFDIQKIVLSDNNTRAQVTMKAKVTLMMAGAGTVDLDVPSTTDWKRQGDQWVYVIAPDIETPFGKMNPQAGQAAAPTLDKTGKAPDIKSLMNAVKLDREMILMTSGSSEVATITNDLPGEVILEMPNQQLGGVTLAADKTHLGKGEKATLRFTAEGTVAEKHDFQINVMPLGTMLTVHVEVK